MDAGKYVVLDVETNGLSSLKHDLLSISIYKPDEDKIYERFLPLELNDKVYTTKINGITKKKLRNAKPLTQIEVDALIVDFDLNNRTILTYGGIDEKFIRNYFRRKHIEGYSRLTFYNFKKDIISSKFSGGNVTKDNLCNLFNIKNVQSVHSGKSDCILEWKLFEKLNGDKLLITEDKVFLMNDSYIIPASFFHTHSNIKYCISKLPYIHVEKEEIKRFSIYGKNIKKFDDGSSLITVFLKSLVKVKSFDDVYVFCSNPKIKEYIVPGVKYLERPAYLDTQEATPQDIMGEFIKRIDADIYAVCHCTSPFVSVEHFEECVAATKSREYDSSFTAEKLQHLMWTDKNEPLNFDPTNVPRTQDLPVYYNEVSAAYVFKKEVYEKYKRRIGIKPHITEVSGVECVDIDYPEDFEIANAIYMSMIKGEK